MEKDKLIELLCGEIEKSPWDIKAEAQLLLASKKGLSLDDIQVICDMLFKREYSKDVMSAALKEDPRKQSILELHLSRNGIFDQLPEGLFFQMAQQDSKFVTVEEMASGYKKNKKKEEEIRRFFLPFENDFFLQRMQIEEQETMLLEGLRSGILNDYFIRFWDLPASIPKVFVIPLILMLPHAYKIAGDLELTAQCLSQLLKEEVQLNMKAAATANADTALPPMLGEGQLGLDLICGDEFWEDDPRIEIIIGPLINSKVRDYLEGGRRATLMETFIRFFIPAGIDSIISIQLPPEKEDMLLAKGSEPILGYSTVLG